MTELLNWTELNIEKKLVLTWNLNLAGCPPFSLIILGSECLAFRTDVTKVNWLVLDHLIKYYERDELMKGLANLQVKNEKECEEYNI